MDATWASRTKRVDIPPFRPAPRWSLWAARSQRPSPPQRCSPAARGSLLALDVAPGRPSRGAGSRQKWTPTWWPLLLVVPCQAENGQYPHLHVEVLSSELECCHLGVISAPFSETLLRRKPPSSGLLV